MLETDIEDGYSLAAWVAQQILSMLVPMIFIMVVESNIKQVHWPLDHFRDSAMLCGAGFLFAVLVHWLFPRAAVTGRWVWTLPTSLLALAFVGDALTSSFGRAFVEFFYPGPNGEAGWAMALVTYPTGSAIAYSLGMLFATRKARRRLASSFQNPGADESGPR